MVRNYINFITNPDIIMPPFRPVLYRAIACGGKFDFDSMIKNEISHHKAKTRLVMNELIELYRQYQQLLLNNFI